LKANVDKWSLPDKVQSRECISSRELRKIWEGLLISPGIITEGLKKFTNVKEQREPY
jgi:hypothetical protein